MRATDVTTYVTMDTPLGAALVAATAHGVCDIALGDDPAALTRDLETRVAPSSCCVLDTASPDDVRRWLSVTVEALRAVDRGVPRILTQVPDVPLDVGGTTFQQAIWAQLRRVPHGQVLTYTDLARAVGAPRSVRAVGSACGANRLALLIPCHRAVRKDGALGGFRWGLDRKARLLAWERTGQ